MPHKHNAARRHHIGKMKFKVTNWAEYETGLRRRGSLTLWITPEALSGWAAPRRKTRGGQPLYSDVAIETTLTLGMVFGLRLRQSEGLLSSVLDIMRLDLPVPDHTTLSRRARTWKPSARSNDRQNVPGEPIHVLVDSTGLKIYGAGQWLEEKHGTKSRRGWRKLHLAVDADSGEIIAHSLTDQETGDASQLQALLDQIDDEIGQLTADGAYDGDPSYDAVLRHSADARVVIPPRSNAVVRPTAQACCQRDDHITSMQIDGRLKWQASTGYGKRALAETAMGRYKGVIGPRLRARSFLAQQTEAAIGVTILNRMRACGRPKSVRCQASAGATK
ncbi:IS5 family transposase [Hoeflea sp.]|uniref:IS5 family transposase n=1 Tax=Hoeflea sp. TaxID=1940281 RepID=UPI0019A5BC1E|nr:IS5 family transposase [Hoeflea sp.]MBC7211438.1 IS5 family transposase [Pseudomonas sp.]MBC7284430.1 IS5 family transposase [Hoeflea sp.]